jgi:hypothetical protein
MKLCGDCKFDYLSAGSYPCNACKFDRSLSVEEQRARPLWQPIHDSQAPTEGRKDDSGKLRYDLVPVKSLEALVGVYTFGAAKYQDRNWEKGISWCRIFAAIMRHSWAWFKGEDYDPESGIHHMAHAAFGCFALIEYSKTKPELDDRVKES